MAVCAPSHSMNESGESAEVSDSRWLDVVRSSSFRKTIHVRKLVRGKKGPCSNTLVHESKKKSFVAKVV